MYKQLSIHTTYETRDGVIFDKREHAVRHEHRNAIPIQLAALIKSHVSADHDVNLSATQVECIAAVLLANRDAVMEALHDYIECANHIEEWDKRERVMADAERILAEKGLSNARD
jgi:hypothetical protein